MSSKLPGVGTAFAEVRVDVFGKRSIKGLNDSPLMKLSYKSLIIISSTIALACSTVAGGTQSYIKQWDTAVVIGSIPNSNFRYYFEPQLRLIADHYIFNESLLFGGLGYQVNQNLILFAGTGWIFSKSPQGKNANEIRIWEQASWRVAQTDEMTLDSRTRLEERKNTSYSQYATRFRQRIWIHIPFQRYPEYSFSCFDEIFFDLNHPAWVSPYFFSQNRAFIGIGKQMTKDILLDAGYLNQYLHSRQNQLNHVLLISFSIRA